MWIDKNTKRNIKKIDRQTKKNQKNYANKRRNAVIHSFLFKLSVVAAPEQPPDVRHQLGGQGHPTS